MWTQSDTVLEVEGISKLYSRSQATTRNRLAHTLSRTLLGRSLQPTTKLDQGEFWSLKNINFTLREGEAFGIIGLNGAGKTTLLRILAGQILPDQGEIRVLGKSAAMIDLTAGFQVSASGARNIYLRGALLGRSKEEISATYDEIVDFAELDDAIGAPLSTYSTGMLMRLAFSIMVAMEPDILFIDEILSVGDFRFRQKCLSKIRELREKTAFVLVSHSMNVIKSFCDQAILLHKGEVVASGDPEDVVSIYEQMQITTFDDSGRKRSEILKPQFHNDTAIEKVKHYWCDVEGAPITEIRSGEDLYLRAIFKINHKPRNLILGVPVWTEEGVYVTGFSTETQGQKIKVEPLRNNEFLLKVPTNGLNPGVYVSNLAVSDGLEFLYRGENSQLEVIAADMAHWGVVSLPHRWEKIG